jgi:peptidoglycan-associated lipoprotein
MAKSKLLATAAMSSAILLVACGGNTQTDDAASTTTTTGVDADTELTIEPEEEIVLEIEQVEPEVVIEEMVEDMSNALLDLTIVYFDFDKSSIRADFTEILDAHAAFLAANPDQMVVLEGHADERGTREYNLALGERRAKQVATYLQIKGVSAAQIDSVSYGEEMPMAIGKTESEYSQNRRVEIVYK